MGIDWYTKHVELEHEWKELAEGVTLWKCYEKGTFPEGHKDFEHVDHPSGAEVILTENSGPLSEEETKGWPQEDIDQWMRDTKPYSYLSFRASSYPGLGEKVNLITEYFLSAKDYELEEFVVKALADDPEASERSESGVNFFKSVLGSICQLGMDEVNVGGRIEDIDALSSRISGAIYFRDLKWQECGLLSKLLGKVAEYCKGKAEITPDGNNFLGYHAKYFGWAAAFMNTCFINQANVVSSY